MSETALRQDEAVELGHALAAHVANVAGVRVLFIKGPTAVASGARPPRASADVDILVEPSGFEVMCQALQASGWMLRRPIGTLRYAGDFAFEHSAHFLNADWPCDIDVHYNFPGFLGNPGDVFEALWRQRISTAVAGRKVDSPAFVGQVLIVGLHALRSPAKDSARADLAHLTRRLKDLSNDLRYDLRRLARETGCSGSAGPILAMASIEPEAMTEVELERLVDWQLHQEGLGFGTAWLAELQGAPWHQRPGVIRRALFPPADYFVGSHRAPQVGTVPLLFMQFQRLLRAIAGLPRAVSVLRRRRRR